MTRGGKNAKKRAIVAVARKLAVLLHQFWSTARSTNRFIPNERIARQPNEHKTRDSGEQHSTKSRVHGDCDGIFGPL